MVFLTLSDGAWIILNLLWKLQMCAAARLVAMWESIWVNKAT